MRDSDRDLVAHMRALLWPDASVEEHWKELDHVSRSLPSVILVATGDDGIPVGFLEVGVRSHADGCDPAQPVGFVEGWFVEEEFRQRGVGRQLMRAAEEWARAQGCREMPADTWMDHESQRAHEALGFEVVDRCINFRRQLA